MSRVCRTCKIITDESACPICKGLDLSDDYSGLLIILNPKDSQIAKRMEIEKEGRYALRIR